MSFMNTYTKFHVYSGPWYACIVANKSITVRGSDKYSFSSPIGSYGICAPLIHMTSLFLGLFPFGIFDGYQDLSLWQVIKSSLWLPYLPDDMKMVHGLLWPYLPSMECGSYFESISSMFTSRFKHSPIQNFTRSPRPRREKNSIVFFKHHLLYKWYKMIFLFIIKELSNAFTYESPLPHSFTSVEWGKLVVLLKSQFTKSHFSL